MINEDIVINSTGEGTLGRVGLFLEADRIDNKIVVPDSHVTIVRISKCLYTPFYYYALLFNQHLLEKMGTGSTKQTELNCSSLQMFLLPVPPLSAQKRIADKISQFMEMERSLTRALGQ